MREAYSFPSWFLANWSRLALPAGVILLLLLPSLVVPGNEDLILVAALLPLYMLHQYEEHAHGRFVADVNRSIGHGLPVLTPTAAFWLNIILVWAVFLAVFAVTRYLSPLVIFIPIYATLINAITHIAAAVQTRSYNPGLITAIVLFLPASIYALIETSRTAPDPIVAHLIGFGGGLLAHLIIIGWVLFQRQRLLRAARKANPGAYPTAGTGFLPALLAPAHSPGAANEPPATDTEIVEAATVTPSPAPAAKPKATPGPNRHDPEPVIAASAGTGDDDDNVVIAPARATSTHRPPTPADEASEHRPAGPVVAADLSHAPDRSAVVAPAPAAPSTVPRVDPPRENEADDIALAAPAIWDAPDPATSNDHPPDDEPADAAAEPPAWSDRDPSPIDTLAPGDQDTVLVDAAATTASASAFDGAAFAPDAAGSEPAAPSDEPAGDPADHPAGEPIADLDSLNLRVLPIDPAAPDLPSAPPLLPDDDASPDEGGYSRPPRR